MRRTSLILVAITIVLSITSLSRSAFLPVIDAYAYETQPIFLPLPISTTSSEILDYSGSFTPTTNLRSNNITLQAELTNSFSAPTANIVNARVNYEIGFKTSTSGIIKSVEMTFPAGTNVDARVPIEVEGLGPGFLGVSGNSLIYNVFSPVEVPAGTEIRFEIGNILNPSTPNSQLEVSITTKNANGTTIDGPTATFAYFMKQIGTTELQTWAVTNPKISNNAVSSNKIIDGQVGTNDLANGAITAGKISPSFMVSRLLEDNAQGHSFGWDPDGIETNFIIIDDTAISGANPVLINVGDSGTNSQCEALGSLPGFFTIECLGPPPQGSQLRYTITNIPRSM